jgi:hypothetical protein
MIAITMNAATSERAMVVMRRIGLCLLTTDRRDPGTVGADTSRGWSSRLQPGLRHSTFDDVPLNPFALRAGKRSQVLARRARLNRRQTHWRTAGGALRALILSIEHECVSSVWSPEFARKPTGCLGCEGIRCNDVHLNVIALWTLEQPVLKTNWTRCHAFQHHPRLAAGTARAFNSREGRLRRGHGASLRKAGALPDSQSPMIAVGGAVISQLCPSSSRK